MADNVTVHVEDKDEQQVDPWTAHAAKGKKTIDYDKLIREYYFWNVITASPVVFDLRWFWEREDWWRTTTKDRNPHETASPSLFEEKGILFTQVYNIISSNLATLQLIVIVC